MYCLDTSVIVEYLRGNKEIIEKINQMLDVDIFLTPISLCELYKGAYLADNSEFKSRETKNFISFFYLLDFDEEICIEYGKQYAKLSKLGKLVPDFDLVIACFAKLNNLILITRDNKHFENTGIKLEVW